MMIRKGQNRKGFTLVESLYTVVIIIGLLAISIVAVSRYMRYLQITELDNAARAIYMAAQNRAVLLKNSERLDSCVMQHPSNRVDVNVDSEATTQITAYYIHCTDQVIEELLPEETIESSLWNGDFYIVYEPSSGSVTDVFFSKEELPVEDDFWRFYDTWRAANKTLRMKQKPMIGYYGGDSATSGNTISLRTPVINIYNEEVLKVEVTYWVPRTLAIVGEEKNVKLDVTLKYQETEQVLLQANENASDAYETVDVTRSDDVEYLVYTYTWILDSVESGRQFKDIFGGIQGLTGFGDDFEITAEVYYESDKTVSRQVNGAKKTATDNSLFAKGSGDETAYIGYMRHLQNLNADFSDVVETKTAAVQIDNITCTENYNFIPVENDSLLSYDGAEFAILNLYSAVGADGTAGLFGTFKGQQNMNKTLSNIRLVNASVSGNSFTGALVGEADYVDIDNCLVYWEETSATKSNLRDLLGDSENGYKYYVMSDTYAGGLAGSMQNGRIVNSAAATMIAADKANAYAGGLVGYSQGNLTITDAYSDCYLSSDNAAGLIGCLDGKADISNSYAVGYINSPSGTTACAAGFCLGTGNVHADASYSAMLFTKNAKNYPLAKSKSSTYAHTYYLNSDYFSTADAEAVASLGRSYETLTDTEQWETLFGADNHFEVKNTSDTHAYNLQTTLSLTSYNYPGLKEKDHYGDWGAQFQNGSLVYFETYQDGKTAYGFNGGSLNLLLDEYAVEDGYAIAFRSTDVIAQHGMTIEVTYYNNEGKKEKKTLNYGGSSGLAMYPLSYTDKVTGKTDTYYLLPLPGYIVNTEYASSDFYQEISFVQGSGTEKVEGHYYYNPHFANAVINYDDDLKLSEVADGLRAEIRTPRHLYMLSEHQTYATSGHQYNFVQQMNIDYSVYTAYDLFTGDFVQKPIGTNASKPFRNNYYGNCHTIENVMIDTSGYYIGLFGYSTGSLEDIAYLIKENTMEAISRQGSTSGTVYAGGLVGYNGGIVHNCAVAGMSLSIYTYEFSTTYVGGLVGLNRGTVSDSSAALTGIRAEATLANAYVGGFVGSNDNGGIISQCYTVGRISASRSRYGSVYACGFAGNNQGTISRSYAAADLQISGGAEAYGFSKDKSENCYYLNDGNFIYEGEVYSAQYSDPYAREQRWSKMTNDESQGTAALLGFGMNAANYGSTGTYPYPAVVRDADGNYIHYGSYPDLMDLGVVGICYWEKEVTYVEQNSVREAVNTAYHFSTIMVDMNDHTVTKTGTLCEEHDDGGVIEAYGYGYFYDVDSAAPTLVQSGMTIESSRNSEAEAQLMRLMENKYTFVVYTTAKTGDTTAGIYPDSSASSGTWTLRVNNADAVFRVCPFFADAMAYEGVSGTLSGVVMNKGSNVPTEIPGSSRNMYQVRSITQLQFINWNKTEKNTTTVVKNSSSGKNDTNKTQFMFLSYNNNSSIYSVDDYWKQTHDLNGLDVNNYMPIAGFCDQTPNGNAANAAAWFSGTYDGNEYAIQEVSISTCDVNTTGLFGVTVDAELKNIVLYSPSGKATITATNSKDNWYAIGGLVGMAAKTANSTKNITNCSVAGYTIVDKNTKCAYGGGGVGGLVGICNMALSQCAAVTDIQLNFSHSDSARNVRVGGIAGSCQQVISQCYAGGSITISSELKARNSNSRMHVGGIAGGYFMKPMALSSGITIRSDTDSSSIASRNIIKNCYSYVTLPAKSELSNSGNSNLFVIGGMGEIFGGNVSQTINCYYLDSSLANVATSDLSGGIPSGVKACTYEELSNPDSTVYISLVEAGFSTVTTKNANGNTINGKYSLAVSDKLLGENYPFPTILTQETGSGSQRTTVNVHYGDWPISGIERENGGLPVDIDLFADYDSQAQSAVAIERLTLSSLVSKKNGKLTVTVENSGTDADASDTPVAEAAFAAGDDFTDGSAELFITGLRAGYAKVTVTYTTSDAVYTTTIDVQVTAQLYMMSTTVPVIAFTNETAEAQLEMKDSQGVALPDELKEKIDILSCNVEADMNYLDVAMAQLVMDETTGKFVPGMAQLVLDTAGQTGETQLNVTYIYSYLGQEYTATTPVALQIQSLKVEFEPLHIYLDGKTEATMIYTSDQVQIRVGEDEELASDVQMIDFENSEDRNIVFAEWQDNKKQALRISGYSTDTDSGSAYLKLQVQFTYGGSKHTLWGYLGVIVHNGAEEDSDDNETETEINVLPVSPGNQETESQTEIESETEKSETQDGDGV